MLRKERSLWICRLQPLLGYSRVPCLPSGVPGVVAVPPPEPSAAGSGLPLPASVADAPPAPVPSRTKQGRHTEAVASGVVVTAAAAGGARVTGKHRMPNWGVVGKNPGKKENESKDEAKGLSLLTTNNSGATSDGTGLLMGGGDGSSV